MLRNAREVAGYVLQATDGEIGRATDFLFDDREWTVRYMVADTRKWLPGRKVLIPPRSLGQPDWLSKRFPVRLSRAEITDAPALDDDAPVSRQYERDYHGHFGWPFYWEFPVTWGTAPDPATAQRASHFGIDSAGASSETPEPTSSEPGDPNLRSVNEVSGYDIVATDGKVGHVEDFILDDTAWGVRYLVVDTRNWLPGRKVLVSPSWFRSFDSFERNARVDLTTDAVKNSPEYDPTVPINREFEARLYDFYGRPKYWESELEHQR